MALPGSNHRGKGRTPSSASPARAAATPASRAAKSSRPGVLNFDIPSDFSSGREVQRAILEEAARMSYDSHSTFAIRLALEEALINAIKHGNRFDPGKRVRVRARLTAGQAEIVVEDQGPGFKRCCVPDPTCGENLEKCSGRGILLMESYMDEVEYDRGGRRVRLVKKKR